MIADWGSGLPGGPRDVPYGQAPRSVARSSTLQHAAQRARRAGIPGSPTPTRAAARRRRAPPAVPRGLVERLIVVQYVLPLRVNKAADGGWVVTWDDTSLLATSVQGGRHLMGSGSTAAGASSRRSFATPWSPPSADCHRSWPHLWIRLASPHPEPPCRWCSSAS